MQPSLLLGTSLAKVIKKGALNLGQLRGNHYFLSDFDVGLKYNLTDGSLGRREPSRQKVADRIRVEMPWHRQV